MRSEPSTLPFIKYRRAVKYVLSKPHKEGPVPFLFQRPLSAWVLPPEAPQGPHPMGRLRAPSLPHGYPPFNRAMPLAAHGDPVRQALWDGALVQRLGRQDYPVFQGKAGSGCGHYICHFPGICDMLVPPLPDSGYHCQMSQANTEITPASSPLQLNALVWLKECMLYKDMGGEGRRRRAGEDFQQPCRT